MKTRLIRISLRADRRVVKKKESTLFDKPEESDWKTFCKLVPELRARYLRQRNSEFLVVLPDESLTPTEQF